MALVAGMTAAATAGLASQAWAAPSDSSVTERQCFNGDGRVQREADGVGTCVGGTNDGLLVDDGIDHTDDGYGTSSSRSGSDDDSDDGYGDRSSDGYGYGSDDDRRSTDDSDSADRDGRATSRDSDDDRPSRTYLPSRSGDSDDDLDS